jgi:hypothetical protein
MAKIVVLAGGDDAEAVKTALDGAGVDYEVVDPTPANLLHIVIGMVDDGEPKDEEPEDKEPKEPKEPKADAAPADDAEIPPESDSEIAADASAVKESLGQVRIDGELIEARLGKGPISALRAVKIEQGPRTSYTINESTFSFWPSNPSAPAQRIVVEHGSHRTSVEVRIENAEGNESYFLVGADLADLFKA